MKAKRLIEVAMPVKEVSAESVRDKYIHNGHKSLRGGYDTAVLSAASND